MDVADSSRVTRYVIPAVVCALVFAAFRPALDAQFINYDDDVNLTLNPDYRGFGPDQLRWMFSTTKLGNYQPIVWLSWALDYKISGMHPSSYHRNNVILHVLNALLLYFILVRLLGRACDPGSEHPRLLRCAAGAAALFFGVHPMRVESVAWATERRDVLSGFFLLAALLSYLRSLNPPETKLRSTSSYVASVVLLVLSLLSKVWGMTFVVVITILDVYPLRRLPIRVSQWGRPEYRPVWRQKAPFLMLSVASAAMALAAQGAALRSLEQWPAGGRLAQALFGLAYYVRMTFVPAPLVMFHDIPYRFNLLETRFVLSAAGVLAGVLLIVLTRRRWPGLAASAAIYVVLVSPVLGLSQAGGQLVANRYSYVACMAWSGLAGGALLALARRTKYGGVGVVPWVACMAALGALYVATHRLAETWKSDETLWPHAVATNPHSAEANLHYAMVLEDAGRTEDALRHYRRCVELRPDKGQGWRSIGDLLKRRRDFSGAERAYLEALDHIVSHVDACINLGNMYLDDLHAPDKAIPLFRDAIGRMEAAAPGADFSPAPYVQLGRALAARGQYAEARPLLEKALQYPLTHDLAQATLNLMGR